MEKELDPLLLRAHLAAAISKAAPDVTKAMAKLSLGSTGEPAASANTLADALGGTAVIPEALRFQVEDWLEWEETVLRPAARATNPNLLQSALDRLAETLSASTFLVGKAITLADVAVFSTLLSMMDTAQAKIPAPVDQYLTRLQGLEAVKAGLASAQSSREASSQQAQTSASAPSQTPVLPIKGQRNLLITSALPYVNNVPHLGNIVGCVLSADCYARYARSRGYNTVYVCGTDEYGTATETKALEEGLSCQQICDKYHAIHKEIYEWFEISFDKFGRTPTWQQTEICQAIFQRLSEEDYILEDTIEQLFSEALGKFLADRFVLGTCPKCKYEDAKGDQCDNCGTMLNPTELINPRCKITGTTPVLRRTKHLFLDLPKLTPELQAYINTTSQLGGWSANCVATTKSWMRDGLKPRCISRDLIWGTPIPFEGYENKVFYVWFDAPIGYVSITANYTDDWKAWWQNPEEVDLVQFMGKDNVPFHTIIFPATQIGTRQPWTKMKNISVTEYLNYEGGKFSKSRNTGVFGDDARDTGIPVEVWRYYLLSNRPEVSDTDFKWSDMRARLNNELLANLGNFVNRALVFTANKFDSVVPEAKADVLQAAAEAAGAVDSAPQLRAAVGAAVAKLSAQTKELVDQYVAAMEAIKLRDGIKLAMAVSGKANKFLQDHKPWELRKGSQEEVDVCGTIINVAVGVVLVLAALIEPYMPSISAKMVRQLNVPASAVQLTDAFLAKAAQLGNLIPSGHKIGTPEVLFREISPEIEAHLRQRFGGESDDLSASLPNGKPAAGAKPAAKAADGKAKAAKAQKPTKAEAQQNSAPKEKKVKAPAVPKAAAPTDISAVDLRVGVINKAWKHENAESLYVEEIECGEAQPRQVVSGLVKYIPLEEMQGKRVVIVANLKAGNMRGVKSHAMVLAASSADGEQVELVEPPAGAPPGERVMVAGFAAEPVAVLKKEAFDPIASGLRTNADRVACYNGAPLQTSQGVCTVKSIADGGIR